MAYNKSKFVEAAQKLLNQGKVAQAIAEYQQILKYEPRDQVTLMTIGELYIRQGETLQAIDYFERLAQLFVSDGFLTKAIAVYKRIAKLAPEEIRPLEKLADLYVQQGVMSEARPLFLQLAELHLKNGKQPEAIALLKKLLQAEPDNLRIQIRLADLYQAMGQSADALETYVSAAQRALARGEQAECEKLADKALHLRPKHLDALIVKARSYMTQGQVTQAAEILEAVADLDKGGEPAELLMDLYLKNDKWDEATGLALRIFSTDEKNFSATQKVTEALLESGQGERAMSVLSRIRVPMIDAGEHEGVVHLLNQLASRLPGRLEPLEWLVDTFGRTSDSFRLPDALMHLGNALVASGKLQRAREVFQQLVDRDPESDPAKRKLNEVLRKMGVAAEAPPPAEELDEAPEALPTELPQPPAPKIRPAYEAPVALAENSVEPPPPVEPELDEETQKFITQSLTDVDLFASYGLTQKAIGLLEAILRRAPTHTPTLEKLLDFVLGAGDDRRTAELAAQLEHIHGSRGDARSSERFGELRRRFQRAAGMTDDEVQAAVDASMPQPVETIPVEEGAADIIAELPQETVRELGETAQAEGARSSPAAADAPSAKAEEPPEIEIVEETPEPAATQATAGSRTEEVDLSSEWAALLEETKDASAPPPAKSPEPQREKEKPAGTAAEPQAEPFLPKSEDTSPAEFHVPVEEVDQEAASSPLPDHSAEPAPIEAGTPVEEVPHAERERGLEEGQPAVHEPHGPAPEFELDEEFELVLEPENVVPPHEMLPPVPPPSHEDPAPAVSDKAPANGSGFSTTDFLSDLAKEIDELGLDKLVPPSATAEPAAGVNREPEGAAETVKQPVGVSGEPGPLKEVFDEFRAELGEMGSEDEDLETHYNLGIAFREMGLLEEAIGEFQKVAKANARGKAFRYSMQCCTLLGLAFMEKGQPNIAAIWYERALNTQGIDGESKLALRYDLGVAQESAGELEAALKSFSQVYAVNIDYRDVAERIASLQKPAR